jgi:hypothetical protein
LKAIGFVALPAGAAATTASTATAIIAAARVRRVVLTSPSSSYSQARADYLRVPGKCQGLT